MKKSVLFAVVCSWLSILCAKADNYENFIYVDNMSAAPGSSLTMSVQMNNFADDVTGFQFDLVLPEGVTVPKNSDGKYEISLSTERATSEKIDFFACSDRPDGSIRVLAASTTASTFSGQYGEVITVPLQISPYMRGGVCPIVLKDITISNIQGFDCQTSDRTDCLLSVIRGGRLDWNFNFSQESVALLWNYCYNGQNMFGSYLTDNTGYYDNREVTGNNGEKIPELTGLLFSGWNPKFYIGTGRCGIGNSSYETLSLEMTTAQKGNLVVLNYSCDAPASIRMISSLSSNLVLLNDNQIVSHPTKGFNDHVAVFSVTDAGSVRFSCGLNEYNIMISSISQIIDVGKFWSDTRAEIESFIGTLDSFSGLKKELQTAYNTIAPSDSEDPESVYDAISQLEAVMFAVKSAVESYDIIVYDIAMIDPTLDPALAEALALGQAFDSGTAVSSEFLAILETLENAVELQAALDVDMTDWSFYDYGVIIDEIEYYFDVTHEIAEARIGWSISGSEIVIPATVRYEGTDYRVVSISGNGHNYTKTNVTSVILPNTLRRISSYAFYNLPSLTSLNVPSHVTYIGYDCFSSDRIDITLNSLIPPTLDELSGKSNMRVHVPEKAIHDYFTSSWSGCLLIGGDGITVTVNNFKTGSLARTILNQTSYLHNVNVLMIDGDSLNTDDWNAVREMSNLYDLDIAGVANTVIPSSEFSNSLIEKVRLPEGLVSLRNSAFENSRISAISVPDGLKRIGDWCFGYCYQLREFSFPSCLASIGTGAFCCTGLASVILPSCIQVIPKLAFSSTAIVSLEIPEGVRIIEYAAFAYNHFLAEAVLPSSLESIEKAAFYDCGSLTEIEIHSAIPPLASGSDSFCSWDNDAVLYVPSVSLIDYKLSDYWKSFPTIEGIDFLPQNITVTRDYCLTLDEELPGDYHPDIRLGVTYDDYYYLYSAGSLTVSGRSMLDACNVEYLVSLYEKYCNESKSYSGWYDYYPDGYLSTPLVVKSGMRSDNVRLKMTFVTDRWQFVTFPFDVKVGDIVPESDDIQWVIRGHSGSKRATGQMDSVWYNLRPEDILEAGKGYIMHCSNKNNFIANFEVHPYTASVNRQMVFSSENRTLPLEQNLSQFEQNSNWNLIGNPYPCYYDTRHMNINAPIVVWNSYFRYYEAYSLADDEYILSPGEAFFVQAPFDCESVTFNKEGRQTDMEAKTMLFSAPYSTMHAERTVINIILSDDSFSDRTRVVLSDRASIGYENSCDVSKFAPMDASVSQIYTWNDNIKYAINERPFASGSVRLGVHCGVGGDYTISVPHSNDYHIVLEDKANGSFTELTGLTGYTFHAETGDYNDRFVLYFSEGEVTGTEVYESEEECETYDINGIRSSDIGTGHDVYIKNGKKFAY